MNPDEPHISRENPELERTALERTPLSEKELSVWEREDREEAAQIAAIERELAGQTSRVVELEQNWKELAERAVRQVDQARELEGEVIRLRELADKARAARRAASAELSRAERRAVSAHARAEELERENGERVVEFEDRLTKERGAAVRFERAAADQEVELAKARKGREALEAETVALRQRLEQDAVDAAAAREELGDLVAARESELADSRVLRGSLEAELAALREANSQEADRSAAVRNQLSAELRELMARRESELKVAEQVRAGLEAELASYREQIVSNRETVRRHVVERDRLTGELERALSEAEAERERLLEAQRRLETDLLAAREDATRAQAEAARMGAERDQATEAAEREAVERRALVSDLVGTQATLQARSEQLQNILRSKWHRIARSAWQARRRRPPLGALALAAVAIAGTAAGVLAAEDFGTAIASLLAGLMVATLALAYAIVVPGLRDKRVPRMAGDGSFVRSLDTVDPEDPPAAAQQAVAWQPAATPAPEAVAGVRLVPVLTGGSEVEEERQRWLAGTRMPSLKKLRVAGILDEMSRASFGPECELDCGFGANDWRERLTANPPHMLLVESAWAGNDGGWQYCVASYGHHRFTGLPFLKELLEWCTEQGIPTVFWNKEDPVHFDRFSEAAALFDHVFTSDANRIDAYRQLTGARCKSVEALPFAAQPKLHNPIPLIDGRLREPVFAGTYYRDRHPDRQRSLEAILDAARPHGLVIYDRTFGSSGDAYGFPERFLPHVRGRLSYEDTVAEYKRHLVFLNVNSVTNSPTMFSRRVFELLACGTAVLSTPSVGMQEMFGDLVPVAESEEQASAALSRLLEDDRYRQDLSARAQRLVLSEHTYRDRLLQIVRSAGFDFPESTGEETSALALVDRPDELEAVTRSLLEQRKRPDEAVIGLAEDADPGLGLGALERDLGGTVRLVRQPRTRPLSERWRELAALSTTPWVAVISPSARYEHDHLEGLVSCTRFAEADLIGVGGSAANRYGEPVSPDAAIACREVVARRGWPADAAEMRRWIAQGIRIYAAEPHGRTAL